MGKASRRKQFDTRTRLRPAGSQSVRKLSACLLELIAPYRAADARLHEFEDLITLAATAWNLATFPPEERESVMTGALESNPERIRRGMRDFLLQLLERKERLFPNDQRLVGEYKVLDEGDGYRVVVASIG